MCLVLLLRPPLSCAAGPFSDNRLREPNYAGPGREQGDPPEVKEVLLGYFGPVDDSGLRIADCGLVRQVGLEEPNSANPPSAIRNRQFLDMWCAARLAVEQANRAGGYQGLPFRLVGAWSADPWGSGVKDLTRLVYTDNVWAILGGVDGPTTHLAEQVAVKARVPLLNPVSTDKTVNLINVPWIFSCTPQDHIQARALVEGIAEGGRTIANCRWRMADGGFIAGQESEAPHPQAEIRNPKWRAILVSAVDHDSHLFCIELQRLLTVAQLTYARHYQFKPDDARLQDLVAEICGSKGEAVILLAGPRPAARLLRALRENGYSGSVYGGPWMGQRAFLAAAGSHAEGVVFPCSYVPAAEAAAFEADFAARFGCRPDYLAAHTYDAVNLLVAAVRRAGLNRAAIRDALRESSPWNGVSGPILWDPPGGNCRPVRLCTIRDGRIVPLAPVARASCPPDLRRACP